MVNNASIGAQNSAVTATSGLGAVDAPGKGCLVNNEYVSIMARYFPVEEQRLRSLSNENDRARRNRGISYSCFSICFTILLESVFVWISMGKPPAFVLFMMFMASPLLGALGLWFYYETQKSLNESNTLIEEMTRRAISVSRTFEVKDSRPAENS